MPGVTKRTTLSCGTSPGISGKKYKKKFVLLLMEKHSNLSCFPELYLEFLITEYIDLLAQNFTPII